MPDDPATTTMTTADGAAAIASDAPAEAVASDAPRPDEQEHVLEDLLVEDVSIDGMCGVY